VVEVVGRKLISEGRWQIRTKSSECTSRGGLCSGHVTILLRRRCVTIYLQSTLMTAICRVNAT